MEGSYCGEGKDATSIVRFLLSKLHNLKVDLKKNSPPAAKGALPPNYVSRLQIGICATFI